MIKVAVWLLIVHLSSTASITVDKLPDQAECIRLAAVLKAGRPAATHSCVVHWSLVAQNTLPADKDYLTAK